MEMKQQKNNAIATIYLTSKLYDFLYLTTFQTQDMLKECLGFEKHLT